MTSEWVYGTPLSVYQGDTKSTGPTVFTKLYLLADFLCIEELMNHVVDAYISHLKHVLEQDIDCCLIMLAIPDIKLMYDHPTSGYHLRTLIIRYTAFILSTTTSYTDKFDSEMKEIPEFAFDMFKATQNYLLKSEGMTKVWDEPACDYHSHLHTPKCG